MHPLCNDELALAALILEAAIGYPASVYRLIGHPVTWTGALLTWLEQRLNRPDVPDSRRRMCGVLVLTVLLVATVGPSTAVGRAGGWGPCGAAIVIVAATSLLAQRSLGDHVRAVAVALGTEGLDGGRTAVSMIVGRNPARLDTAGVARAAIESLAENFSDGVVAPALWLAIGGLPCAMGYKSVNTADSMIGHWTPRYAVFGWAAARLDDLINLPASRLSVLFLVLAAPLVGASPFGAVRAVWRDARRHRSPNAGWPEAAMAGALGLQLAGPRFYGDTLVEDPFMGHGRAAATAADILQALRLYKAACVVQWLVLLVIVVIRRS